LNAMYPSYMNQLYYSFKPDKEGRVKPDIINFVRELIKNDEGDPNDRETFNNYFQQIRDTIIEEYPTANQGVSREKRWGANNRTVRKYINQYD